MAIASAALMAIRSLLSPTLQSGNGNKPSVDLCEDSIQ